MAYGLRLEDAQNVFVYGAGLYSFFNNYSTDCSRAGGGKTCQSEIVQFDSAKTRGFYVSGLNTVGVAGMVVRDQGTVLAKGGSNVNVYPDTVNFFRSN